MEGAGADLVNTGDALGPPGADTAGVSPAAAVGAEARTAGTGEGATASTGEIRTGGAAATLFRWISVVEVVPGHSANRPRVTSAAATTSTEITRAVRHARNVDEDAVVKGPPG